MAIEHPLVRSAHRHSDKLAPFELINQEGQSQVKGTILALETPHKLALSWNFLVIPHAVGEAPSRVSWEIKPHAEYPGVTLVTVVHDEIDQAANTASVLQNGVPIVLSGLKTWLETGNSLT